MVSFPLNKTLLLVGAGNAHLQLVRMWAMKPVSGVRVVLVNESLSAPYSALVPACIAGERGLKDISVDLVQLCAKAKVGLIHASVSSLDLSSHTMELVGRPPMGFDLISLNVGSRPKVPLEAGIERYGIITKPLSGLVSRIEQIRNSLTQRPRPFRWVVIGGGAGGCEIACAIRKAFTGFPEKISLEILQSSSVLLPGHSVAVSKAFAKTLSEQGISVSLSTWVLRADATHLYTHTNEIPYDAFIWAVQSEPWPWMAEAAAEKDDRGFLKAKATLEILGYENGFAVGDSISLEGFPDLPKAGVFAVREGPVLYRNIVSALTGRKLESYRPQKRALALLNTCDGEAIMSYGKAALKAKWISQWKKTIDEKWLDKFRSLPAMTTANHEQMPCGGCAAKIPSSVLHDALSRLKIGSHPDVLVGVKDAEDVAVMRVPQGKLIAQTTDFFRSFLEDPFLMGQVAAANATSDLYAKNAKPFSALALVTVPFASNSLQQELLFQILSGAVEFFQANAIHLIGGHSAQGPELSVGFTITGFLEQGQMFRKANLKPKDVLLLTKPLGSGALLAAQMQGRCEAQWLQALLKSMTQSNAIAASQFAAANVTAATDVTGFGLAGHLLEMLSQSKMSARLWIENLPMFEGYQEVTNLGIQSTLYAHNAKFQNQIKLETSEAPVLFDPQTSGGLLCGVGEDRVDALVHKLSEQGITGFVIGQVENQAGPNEAAIKLSKKK